MKVLGITVGYNDLLPDWTDLIGKSRAILLSWVHHGLSLFGKISVINTLVASLFVYRMSVLPAICRTDVQKTEALFTEFLWQGKKAKISLHTLKQNTRNGGARLVDLTRKRLCN